MKCNMKNYGLKATLAGSLILAFLSCSVESVPQNRRLGRILALVPPNKVVPFEEARSATLQNARQGRQLSVRPPSRRVEEPLPSPVQRNVKEVQKSELSPARAEELQNSLPLNIRQGRQSAIAAAQNQAQRSHQRQAPRPQERQAPRPQVQQAPRSQQRQLAPQKVIQPSGEHLQNLEKNFASEFPNYDFKYQVHGGGNYYGHEESRRDIKTTGQYHVLLPDGRRQTVAYYVDETGYHPTVTYEVVPDFEVNNKLQNDTGYNRTKRSKNYRPRRKVRVVRRVRMRMPQTQ